MHPGKHFAAFIFILFSFSAAYACSCFPPKAPCNYYGRADAIFLGRVVGSTKQGVVPGDNGNKVLYDLGKIRFLVQENYKGAPGYEIVVDSGTDGGCGYWRFRRNESYVVYAFKRQGGGFGTTVCTRTRPVAEANEDLEYFRGLANAKAGATLYGALTRIIGDHRHGPFEEGPKLAGVKVTVTGALWSNPAVTYWGSILNGRRARTILIPRPSTPE